MNYIYFLSGLLYLFPNIPTVSFFNVSISVRKKEYRGRLEDEIRYLTQTKMETELKYKHMEQTCHKHEAELQRVSALLQKRGGHISVGKVL